MDKVVQTFLDLAAIDEVYPNEKRVLAYITSRLKDAGVPHQQDAAGNIVARIVGNSDEVLGFCGHVDIAAPLNGRKIIIEKSILKTDGVSLLGGDDKTAVAAMLELASSLAEAVQKPTKTLELIFTVGEEAGLKGAGHLDMSLVQAKQMLVFDWLGRVNRVITRSPAGMRFDVTYIGKDAHPAEWQKGKNAGAALMKVAAGLQQGEYAPGVTFNIGMVEIGNARNKIPGRAHLMAEMRSFDQAKAETAAAEVVQIFQDGAQKYGVTAEIEAETGSPAYILNRSGTLLATVKGTLAAMDLKPKFEETYGCFDGNIFATRGIEAIMLGAAYYNPHSPDEYVNTDELTELLAFMHQVTTADQP